MPSPYQDFVAKAKARFLERRAREGGGGSEYVFTEHARHKMRQYGLSEQKVRSVIRRPQRREEGIVPHTVAVMRPPSVKRDATGTERWSQEIWVMFTVRKRILREQSVSQWDCEGVSSLVQPVKIVSVWRYPGVSPKRDPVPEEILRELEEGDIVEEEIFLESL